MVGFVGKHSVEVGLRGVRVEVVRETSGSGCGLVERGHGRLGSVGKVAVGLVDRGSIYRASHKKRTKI